MGQQETKIQNFLDEFGKLLEVATTTRKQLCENYKNAVEACGLEVARPAYENKYKVVAGLLPYMLLVGQGKAHVDILLVAYENVRKRIVKLPIEEQNKFFEDGVDLVDYNTEKPKHVTFKSADSRDWQVLWSDGKNGFRTENEQRKYIADRKIKTGETQTCDDAGKGPKKRHNKKWLFKNGYVNFPGKTKIKAIEVVEILLQCMLEFPELKLNELVHVDLKKYQALRRNAKKK